MKKILVIHNKYQETGGEDISVMEEIKFLNKNFIVEELIFSNKIDNFFSQIFYFLINKNLKSMKSLRKILDEFNPDFVYIHNSWYKASLGIFSVLKQYDAKIIVKLHNFRYFCTKSYFQKNHFLQSNFCQGCGNKKSKIILNKYFKNSWMRSILISRYGNKYFKILKESDLKIVVLTNFHKQFLIDENFNREKIYVCNNFLQVSQKPSESNNKYIVYSGRISEEKGSRELIANFLESDLKDFKLKIIGDGPLLKELKNEYIGFQNIEFLGYMSNDNAREVISKCYAAVSRTKLFEGQPTLLCEASMLGKVSIFPDTGGVKEFYPNNYPFLFEKFDDKDFLEKLNLLTDNDLVNQQSLKNYEFINKLISEEKILDSQNEIFSI